MPEQLLRQLQVLLRRTLMTYDSFGNLVASSGSLVNSFRYAGREFDAETSLYYYRAKL
jgi:FlaA1/EpsC-like NDP-sugar epimerase